MLPYTTPYHRYKLPVPHENISQLYITYSQDELTLFEKSLEDCEFLEDNWVRVLLSQEETGSVNQCGHLVEVQMTLKTLDGKRYTSDIGKLKYGKVLKREVI